MGGAHFETWAPGCNIPGTFFVATKDSERTKLCEKIRLYGNL